MSKLHDCKRGLAIATPTDYNRWWRERKADKQRIEELEAENRAYKTTVYERENRELQRKYDELVEKLEAWCDFYTEGLHPDDAQTLYIDSLCLLDE